MTTIPVLALHGVTKRFSGHLGLGRTTVVNDLTLRVEPGEIFGFLGANGAGKTTTIKMVVGLIFPSSGRIEILGMPNTTARARRRLGYLPENPYFYDYLTAAEFLRYYGHLYGVPASALKTRVPELLERVGLAARADVPLRKFSKGMVQRVGLAQTLLAEPAVVVLDEPMSGLDPVGRRDVRDLLLELRRRGTTVFFSSHILQDAEMICDRVAILAQGRIVTAGKLADLLKAEAHAYEVVVQGLTAEAAARLPGQLHSAGPSSALVRVISAGELEAVLAAAPALGGRVEQISPQRETLEDLFLRASKS